MKYSEFKEGDYVVVIRPVQRYMHEINVDYWNRNIGEMFEVGYVFWTNDYLTRCKNNFNGEYYWCYHLRKPKANVYGRFEGELRKATEDEIDRYFLYKFKDA